MSERPDDQKPLPDDAEFPASEDEEDEDALPLGSDEDDDLPEDENERPL